MFEPIKGMVLPFFIVALSFVALEVAVSSVRKLNLYTGRDSVCNVAILVVGKLSQPLFLGYYFACLKMLEGFRLWMVPFNFWTTVLAVVLTDLVYYWEHRISHKLFVLWLFHEVHHSSKNFNLSTSFRLSWLGRLSAPIIFAPLVLLGFSADQVVLFLAVNLFYQFFLHTQAVRTLGCMEGILNTPSAHRVHHARNELYIDKNFGGILMIWDRIFETYQAETETPEFGILGGFESDNPLTVQFHNLPGYNRMLSFLREPRSKKRGALLLILVATLSLYALSHRSVWAQDIDVNSNFEADKQTVQTMQPIQTEQTKQTAAPRKHALEGHAEVVQDLDAPRLIGTWKGHIKEYGRHPSITIEEQTGSQLRGSYKGLLGRFPLQGTYTKETGNLQLYVDFSGARLLRHAMSRARFSSGFRSGSRSAVAVMNGNLSGDVITGMANIEDMGGKYVHFDAHRSPTNEPR